MENGFSQRFLLDYYWNHQSRRLSSSFGGILFTATRLVGRRCAANLWAGQHALPREAQQRQDVNSGFTGIDVCEGGVINW